jgi:hypothetical protein
MRATSVKVAIAMVLLLGLAGVAQPAAAARAEPFHISGCAPYDEVLEICSEHRGVLKEDARGVRDSLTAVGQFCYTITNTTTGEISQGGCSKYTTVLRQTKDGGDQIYHANSNDAFAVTLEGTRYECTQRNNFTYANGEYRNVGNQLECNPPL